MFGVEGERPESAMVLESTLSGPPRALCGQVGHCRQAEPGSRENIT